MAVAISASLTCVISEGPEVMPACFESDGEDSSKPVGSNTNFNSKDFGPCEIRAEAVQIEHVRVDTFIESFLAIEARRAFRVGGLEVLQGCSAWSLELSCETGWKTGLAGQAGFSSELTGLSLSSSFLSIRDCTSSFRIYHLGGAKKATRVNSFEFTTLNGPKP